VADAAGAVGRALEAWLRARGVAAAVDVEGRTTVGLSQETWLVRVTTDDGGRDAVLRLPTPASGGRAIVTQRTALQAVAGHGLPVPALLWFDDGEENGFGRPFVVMERARGDVPVGWHTIPEPGRTALAEQAINVLAALHEIDPAPLAADAAGRTLPSSLEWARRRLERVAPLPPVVTAALWWLDRHVPPEPELWTIVHGDYRMGNLVVDGGRITGVLDWELAAPGDPVADLTWCFIPVWELAGVDEAALVERYARRSGRPVEPERFHWYRVLGYVRLAYYALSGTRAFDAGASDDLRLAALRVQLPVTLDRLAATLAGEPII
jgi:aminoglycoside phosphotransferase (APT) family kinase protein